MKKYLSLLTIIVLTICLVGYVFDRISPASTVYAGSETHPVMSSAGPSETEAVPITRSVQPVVFIATGLVCVLFGILAVYPLLIEDPAQLLREANRSEK